MVENLDCTGPCGDIVEFGCGYGTFTIPVAKATTGRVIAIDIEPVMVAETTRKAAGANLSNVVGVVRDFVAKGSGLPDAKAGRAMLFNILHIENPLALLCEAYRILAPGGEVAIIHWRSGDASRAIVVDQADSGTMPGMGRAGRFRVPSL